MAQGQVAEDKEPTAVYEIRLRGTSPASLREQFPAATVFTTHCETVLFRRIEEPAELDALIDQLLSMGLVLTEVHQLELEGTSLVEPRATTKEGVLNDDVL